MWLSEEKTLESDFESLLESESKLSSSFDDIEEETREGFLFGLEKGKRVGCFILIILPFFNLDVRYSEDRRSNCFDLTPFEDLNIFFNSNTCLELLFLILSILLLLLSLLRM
jgi:hypothetical protein